MKCKHENADHLMKGESSTWIGHLGGGYIAMCEQFRCIDCGEWLGMGPSNDEPESVRIEILGAFLVSWANAFVNVAHADEHQLDWGSFREDCIGCQAEYLAWECIAMHEEEGR